MKVNNHKDFACFDYINEVENDEYNLGDIVTRTNEDGTEIGVVIQLHGRDEYRTDMFGNACGSEITLSTPFEVQEFRKELKLMTEPITEIGQLITGQSYLCHEIQLDALYPVRCLGTYGVGNKVYLTKAESTETPTTMAQKFEKNRLPDCFVCWDFSVNSSYVLTPNNTYYKP